jgi:hypothetical protein
MNVRFRGIAEIGWAGPLTAVTKAQAEQTNAKEHEDEYPQH